MTPLLVLLERLWGPLRASLTALGAFWGALEALGGAIAFLGSFWWRLGCLLGAQGC